MSTMLSAVSGRMNRVTARRSPIMEIEVTTVSMSLDKRVITLPVPSSITRGTGARSTESSAAVRRSTARRRALALIM